MSISPIYPSTWWNSTDYRLSDCINKLNSGNIANMVYIMDSRHKTKTINEINNDHIRNFKLNMIGFHYFIDNEGNIYQCRPEDKFPVNLSYLLKEDITDNNKEVTNKFNIESSNKIIICIQGDTRYEDINKDQYLALISLLADILSRYPYIKDIYGVNEVFKDYDNPGMFFKINQVRSSVKGSVIPVSTLTPSNINTYTYGKRELYYNEDGKLFSGNDVKLLQYYLSLLGFYENDPNGIFDLFTHKAVQKLQKYLYLSDTGVVNSALYIEINNLVSILEKEYSDKMEFKRYLKYSIFERIMHGPDIKYLKEKLYSLDPNYFTITVKEEDINDEYDEEMKNAVKAFQRDNRLEETGEVGPITFMIITNSVAVSFIQDMILQNPYYSGNDVKFIQILLKKNTRAFGLTNISLNGIYDEITANNILLIRNRLNFEPIKGNIVDRNLWNYLKNNFR